MSRSFRNTCERRWLREEKREIKSGTARPTLGALEVVERNHILSVLEQTQWAIEGERGAARILGLNPSTLRGRMRKLDIRSVALLTQFAIREGLIEPPPAS